MYHALRRTAVIVASSAVVLTGAPLLGTAFAAALTQSTFTVGGSSTTTNVQDSHPTIAATYLDGSANATLSTTDSTITVTEGANNTPVDCPKTVSGNQISCTPTGLLKKDSYNVAFHAVETAPTAGQTLDTIKTFSINVPKISSSVPAANATVASFSSVKVTYDQPIDDNSQISKISVQQIADRQPDGTYAPSSHTPLTGTVQFPNDGTLVPQGASNTATQIEFDPSSTPVNKGIYQVTLDVFGTKGDQTQTTAATENPKAESKDTFTFTMDNSPPAGATNLAESPDPVTSASKAAVTFSGNAKPGSTITVDVFDGTTHFNNAGSSNGGPVTVQSCASATSCPWSKALDLSNAKDGTLAWAATETSSIGSTPETGPSFTKKANPPAGAGVAGSFTPSTSTTLHVTGHSDATVDHYTLDISDSTTPTANKIPTITLSKSDGAVNADGTFAKDVDVTSLNDGTIHMSLVAIDAYGNAAAPATNTATKNSGIQLNFAASFFKQVNLDTPTFADVYARPSHSVQTPSTIAVEFSNPITLVRDDSGTINDTPTDNHGNGDIPAKAPKFVEVLPNGADGNTLQGTAAVSSTDPRQLVVTPPAGFADGTYKLYVNVFEGLQKCDWSDNPQPPSTSLTPAPACPSYDGYVNIPNTTTPFTFTVDSVAPSAPTISTVPASTIDGTSVGDVTVEGTAPGASSITLTAKSSGGGSVLALNGGQPVPVDGSGNWQDDENSAAFAALPDGTVTITGTPTDDAANTGPSNTGTVTLAARPSVPRSLAVSVTETSFTLHWVAPSYDGYPAVDGNATSHLTGYRYTYTDTTDGAVDTSTHTVDVNNASATSATQGNLIAGHSYDVTLCALNGITGPCNEVDTTAKPAFRTTLTAGISKALVVYGNPITLAGRLTRTDIGAGITNEPLTITPHYDNGTTGTVIHITTNATGNWSVTIAKPSKNAVYAVAFNADGADANYQPSNSAVRSLVEVSLRIDKVSSRSTSHVYPVTISGHISPNQSGRTLYIYAKVAGANHYQRIGSAKISSTSTWSYTKTFPKGKYYVYANFPSQNGNVGGSCPSVTFTRT